MKAHNTPEIDVSVSEKVMPFFQSTIQSLLPLQKQKTPVTELEEQSPEEHPPEIPAHVQAIIDALAKAPRSFFTFEEVADSLPRQNREKVIHNCQALIDNEHPDIESMWWEGKEMISYKSVEYHTKIISIGGINTEGETE